MLLLTVFSVCFVIFLGKCDGKQVSNLKKPTKLGSCKAQLEDGRIFDLSSLDKTSKLRIASGGDYNYEFNPCSPFQCVSGAAPLAATCQVSKDGSRSYPIGDQSTADFDLDGNTMVISYNSGVRKTNLRCVCGKSEQFSFQDEDPTNNYNLVFTSPCCCLDGCHGGSGGGSSGLSFGSILLIIFFVSIFVYFVGGFLFLRFVRKNNGLDAVPNRTFWVSLPADIKSGVTFTISKVKGGQGSQYQNI